MSTPTKEWLLKTIAELEEERDAVPGIVNEDAAMALAAMKLALASLEAEPVAWLLSGGGAKNNVSFDSGNAYVDPLREVTPLYIAPPAPVSVPEMKPVDLDEGFDEWYSEGESGADSVAPEWFSEAMKPVFLGTWRACRAAMLQGADGNSPAHSGCRPAQNRISPAQCGNSPAIPDGWDMATTIDV
ncbi:hypothetical protein RCR43_13495 [Enterobacter hormaechei]|uniref:hypothetical protein n=1 Tax=Enterobacter cloacae complex TaxID=354276 RepID=UPI001F262A23|nr:MULTISPECIES: hypothetical protein [Enterobacter cloacae complex]MDF3576234.1 hypothetical protein [Enterobacter hormaechei]MDF3585520.1 hypothetical protein [Enterobacter hormaechei]WGL81752.1 hypothetical protein QFB83_20340 [Enterobacter cloacae]WMQ90309.1 hypothetical protein RCR43_13495 [Enterobacter hormaechei]